MNLGVCEGLSRASWKLSCTVLRGGTDGNVGPLLAKRKGKSKQPFCFELHERQPFAFARLWDRWRAPDDNYLETCTVLTTTPNRLVADIHHRMPVILAPENYGLWLDLGFRDVEEITVMLTPFEATHMRLYPVSPPVNVANDDPDCSEPIELLPAGQASLF
jgi:putative SOS response-associated peptidase YedK